MREDLRGPRLRRAIRPARPRAGAGMAPRGRHPGRLEAGPSLPQLVATVRELEERGFGFRSLTEGVDTTTASGTLVFRNILASQAWRIQWNHEKECPEKLYPGHMQGRGAPEYSAGDIIDCRPRVNIWNLAIAKTSVQSFRVSAANGFRPISARPERMSKRWMPATGTAMRKLTRPVDHPFPAVSP